MESETHRKRLALDGENRRKLARQFDLDGHYYKELVLLLRVSRNRIFSGGYEFSVYIFI